MTTTCHSNVSDHVLRLIESPPSSPSAFDFARLFPFPSPSEASFSLPFQIVVPPGGFPLPLFGKDTHIDALGARKISPTFMSFRLLSTGFYLLRQAHRHKTSPPGKLFLLTGVGIGVEWTAPSYQGTLTSFLSEPSLREDFCSTQSFPSSSRAHPAPPIS